MTSPATDAHLQAAVTLLHASGDYRVLERFRPRHWPTPAGGTKRAVIVDVETTGLSHDRDVIIQLAVCPFEYTADDVVVRADPSLTWLEDPGRSLDPEIVRLTGLTDDMLMGQRIDDVAVAELLESATIVIAHNAAFDRPFLERRLPIFSSMHWACSWKDIPWGGEGMAIQKLEWLLLHLCGKFFRAHDATEDCEVVLELLSTTLPHDGRSGLRALLECARVATVRVWAEGAPFDAKEQLKARQYQWFAGSPGAERAWFRDLPATSLSAELEWLETQVYANAQVRATVSDLHRTVKFSDRTGQLVRRPLR